MSSEAGRYRRKPTEVEAVLPWEEFPLDFLRDDEEVRKHPRGRWIEVRRRGNVGTTALVVVQRNHWLIRNPDGSLVTCPPDVFAETYTTADQPEQHPQGEGRTVTLNRDSTLVVLPLAASDGGQPLTEVIGGYCANEFTHDREAIRRSALHWFRQGCIKHHGRDLLPDADDPDEENWYVLCIDRTAAVYSLHFRGKAPQRGEGSGVEKAVEVLAAHLWTEETESAEDLFGCLEGSDDEWDHWRSRAKRCLAAIQPLLVQPEGDGEFEDQFDSCDNCDRLVLEKDLKVIWCRDAESGEQVDARICLICRLKADRDAASPQPEKNSGDDSELRFLIARCRECRNTALGRYSDFTHKAECSQPEVDWLVVVPDPAPQNTNGEDLSDDEVPTVPPGGEKCQYCGAMPGEPHTPGCLERPIPAERREELSPWTGRADIAWCSRHGLHGARTHCFECGEPVKQVPMVPVRDLEEVRGALVSLAGGPKAAPITLERAEALLSQAEGMAQEALDAFDKLASTQHPESPAPVQDDEGQERCYVEGRNLQPVDHGREKGR